MLSSGVLCLLAIRWVGVMEGRGWRGGCTRGGRGEGGATQGGVVVSAYPAGGGGVLVCVSRFGVALFSFKSTYISTVKDAVFR